MIFNIIVAVNLLVLLAMVINLIAIKRIVTRRSEDDEE